MDIMIPSPWMEKVKVKNSTTKLTIDAMNKKCKTQANNKCYE